MHDYTEALNKKFNGKKILFIGVKFYHYNDEIIKKMKKYGASVTFFYERNVSLWYGLIKNILPEYAVKIQDKHYKNILKKVKGQHYDDLLVIRGYKIEPWFVQSLRADIPALRTIMYQWDSVDNWECDYRYMIPYFGTVKTFDYKDAKALNLPYVPTFHTDEFKQVPSEKPDYDLFYSGGYSYPRYEFLRKIRAYAAQKGFVLKTHLKISIKYYLKEQLAGRKLERSLLSFHTLDKYEYLDLFKKTNIIVDYTNARQTGITMRTLDALGAGKKVLTSNIYISMEPGYDPKQVQIFDPENIEIDPDFINYQTFEKKDYSIERWLNSIFD